MNVIPLSQPDPEPDLWTMFYTLYPRHEARKDAMKAWAKMSEADKLAAVTAIADWRQVWREQGREIHHTPLPASWLNGERWTDEIPAGLIPKGNHARTGPADVAGPNGSNERCSDGSPPIRSQIPAHVLAAFQRLKEGK